ncbi:MAG: hypothetical protein Kow0032_25140 [Methyloligellaceae bacterium]
MILPAPHAAIVGRLAPDRPELHAQVLKTLAEVEPKSAAEAESVVRDVLAAPQVKAVQDSLFGADEHTEILYKERAQILAAAARRVAKDRSAFNVLVREEGRLSAAGNRLETETNIKRVDDDAKILQILQAQSRGTGPLAESLARASSALKGGERLATVVAGFIEDARRGAAEAFSAGRAAGGAGRGGEGGGGGAGGAERGGAGSAGEGGTAPEPGSGSRGVSGAPGDDLRAALEEEGYRRSRPFRAKRRSPARRPHRPCPPSFQ